MNIIIPHSWLKDYLQTKASAQKIAEVLSLCSCSVEKLEKINGDFLYHIEVTTNRADMMSVSGVAREAAAVLTQFGIKADFQNDPYRIKKIKTSKIIKELNVKVNQELCPRFCAIVLENINFKQSAKLITDRLVKSGIRSLNSIVDISNYIMRAFGQPVHTFDYDKIVDHQMTLRPSRKGEKITTLDGKTFILPGNDIVIADGSGELIDLCGIMGGLNSAVSKNTKNVLLFIQTYNPVNIRRTSMDLSQRSEAAAIFEKCPDPELVLPSLIEASRLAKENAGVGKFSTIIDLYPHPVKPKTIEVSQNFINDRMGTKLKITDSQKILQNLGFKVEKKPREILKILVPSWRNSDINIKEDLVEEVARIYGYFNLPSVVPLGLPTKAPDNAQSFIWEKRAKYRLAGWGFTEIYSYSFINEFLLKLSATSPEKIVKLKNPLSQDFVYMRPSLIPSLLQVMGQNQGNFAKMNIFELANIYLNKPQNLPEQKLMLALVSNGDNFYKMKGFVEALLQSFSIKYQTKPQQAKTGYWDSVKSIDYISQEIRIGTLAAIDQKTLQEIAISSPVTAAEIDFEVLAKLASNCKTVNPIPKYPPIIEDLTFAFPQIAYYQEISDLIKKTNSLITRVNLKDSYDNKKTFRIYYCHPSKSLRDEDVALVRKQIVHNLESKGLKLIGKI